MPIQHTDITIYVCPRQIGKTYRLMANAVKSENPVIICQNRQSADHMKDLFLITYGIGVDVYSASSRSYWIGKGGSDVFIDEYDFFRDSDKRHLFDVINQRRPEKVEIYTSLKSPKDNLELFLKHENRNWDLFYDGRSIVYSVSLWDSYGNITFGVDRIKEGINYKPIIWEQVK